MTGYGVWQVSLCLLRGFGNCGLLWGITGYGLGWVWVITVSTVDEHSSNSSVRYGRLAR
ncbi:hypothetical protein FIBSPDRAFT_864745 [Athelia psychrophila]|uniref:Uncharacterized protein n=1 Tax=Athelia psychrophila TaxID=1759441 RepID=A0A166G879_9AGAM|nr:hypothetical protein FIBSPDRAFT_864745 [Fibularhizoctonia sp. CBS 109695]